MSEPKVAAIDWLIDQAAQLDAERALTDAADEVLSEVWDQVPLGFACMPKVQAWLARYREARQQ
jgi:hypothetical protein